MKSISELLAATTERALPVLRGVTEDALTAPTPCPEYDVRALINHLLQVVVNFQALAAKQGTDFSTTPDRTAEGDWREIFADETTRLVKAWAEPVRRRAPRARWAFPRGPWGTWCWPT